MRWSQIWCLLLKQSASRRVEQAGQPAWRMRPCCVWTGDVECWKGRVVTPIWCYVTGECACLWTGMREGWRLVTAGTLAWGSRGISQQAAPGSKDTGDGETGNCEA